MDDGVILQPDDSQKDAAPAADTKGVNPNVGVAKNAPGFDDPKNNEDQVFEITADLNISPIKDDNVIPSMPIDTIVAVPKVIKVNAAPIAPSITPPPSPVSTPAQAPVAPAPTLPTRPGNEPPATDVSAPVHTRPATGASVQIPSNIPNRSQMFTGQLGSQPTPAPVVPPAPAPVAPPADSTAIPPAPVAPVSPLNTLPDMAPRSAPPAASRPAPGYPPAAPQAAPSAPVMRRLDPNLPRDKNIKPLRTYESDVAEALARERTSVTTMAVAENLKRQQQKQVAVAEEEEIPEDEGTQGTSVAKKVLLFLLSLCFLGAGVIGAYYLYSKSPLAPPTPVQPDKPAIISLIPSDSYVLMPTENLNAISLKARIQREMEKSQPEGSIMEIIPTKVVEGQTMRVSAEEMVEIMDVEVPDILMRSLGQATMIGIYTPPRDARSIFAVVTTEFYQNTFAGMIQWESVMADDLKFFLFPDSVRGVANTTTDGVPAQNPQSSDTVAPLLTIRGKFVDRIIKNKDVRQFIADDGRILFMYSLVDNNKLVITDKEITLAEILTRLEKAASIR